ATLGVTEVSMNSTFKSLLFWLAIVVAAIGIYQYSSLQNTDKPLTFTEFLANVEAKKITEVTFTGNKISGKLNAVDSAVTTFHTYMPLGYEGLANELLRKEVSIN